MLVVAGLLPSGQTSATGLTSRTGSPPVLIRVDPGVADRLVPSARPDQPVATLDRALAFAAVMRAQDRNRPITIEMAPGTTRLAHAVRIGPEHGGTAEAPLVIRGAPGGATRIVGAVELHPEPMPPDADVTARLPPEARGHVRVYRLPKAALESPLIQDPRVLNGPQTPVGIEVYDASGALMPARWPNQGWAHVKTGSSDKADPSFTIDEARLERWRDEPDLWAEGYWKWNWLSESIPVIDVDAADRRLRLGSLPFEGILPGARFRISHALSELDEPGEWWRDVRRGLLLAWPRPGREVLDVATVDGLFTIEGASHVRIEQLRLEEARGDLVTVRGGQDVVIQDSALGWAAGRAAVFEDGQASGLVHCDITDIGRSAVSLVGGDRATLRPAGLFVRDTAFTRYARLSPTQTSAIALAGVGAVVAGNFIHDSGGSAIVIRGNDHRIAGNEIARVMIGGTDNGAIYSGRDWTARGTVIEGNFLHDLRAEPGFEVKGVYLDDMASGFVVRDNMFVRVDQAVFLGGGRDNRVTGNTFVAADPAIHIDSRGETWAVDAVKNPESELRAAYAAMPVGSPLWRRRYPGLASILTNAPQVGKDNLLANNIFALSRPFDVSDGGRQSEQTIRDNAGPGGLCLPSGQDVTALAAHSDNPDDFAAFVGPDGTRLPRLDVSGMHRSRGSADVFEDRSR